MAFAKIKAVASSVPERIVTNDDLSKMMDTSDDWIFSRTGIKARHVSTGQNTSDLAADVAAKLLAQTNVDASQLDFIIVATITPDSLMPSTAARVQAKIGATNAFAYDLAAACSGFVFALAQADKLIRSGVYKSGLVIGAETLSKVIDWSDRRTAVLFGDGAAGVLLDNSGTEPLILAEKLQTDGSRGDSLISSYGDIETPFASVKNAGPYLQMEGRAIFEFALRDVLKNIAATIDNSGLAKDEFDYFLLHQANSRILDKMAQKLGLPREKFPQDMDLYGNTSAASVPLLLSETVKNGKILLSGKQKVLLSGFGGGLTWGSLVVRI